MLAGSRIDCVVLDLRLPDMTGLRSARQDRTTQEQLRDLPVVVFTGKELSHEDDQRLHALARSVVVKGVESPERLLDETALFLHRVIADLPPEQAARCSTSCIARTTISSASRVLVVDDDVRNIFALSSVLERRGMNVHDGDHRARGDRRARARRPTSRSC